MHSKNKAEYVPHSWSSHSDMLHSTAWNGNRPYCRYVADLTFRPVVPSALGLPPTPSRVWESVRQYLGLLRPGSGIARADGVSEDQRRAESARNRGHIRRLHTIPGRRPGRDGRTIVTCPARM